MPQIIETNKTLTVWTKKEVKKVDPLAGRLRGWELVVNTYNL